MSRPTAEYDTKEITLDRSNSIAVTQPQLMAIGRRFKHVRYRADPALIDGLPTCDEEGKQVFTYRVWVGKVPAEVRVA